MITVKKIMGLILLVLGGTQISGLGIKLLN